jgi:AcrR family transcriptional regulator
MTGDATKTCLIAAAETLFAEQGIDAVTLRGIQRASGVRNAVAIQYHFGDRDGVLQAILDKHRPEVEARRHAMLDQYQADDAPTARGLAGALVRPLAAKLADPDGGAAFLGIYAELMNRPRPPIQPLSDGRGSSIQRWRVLARPFIDATSSHPESTVRGLPALRFAAAELGRRAAVRRRENDALFVSHVVDLVTAILEAPVSPETARLARTRPARSRASST